jgi:hypothetical protein
MFYFISGNGAFSGECFFCGGLIFMKIQGCDYFYAHKIDQSLYDNDPEFWTGMKLFYNKEAFQGHLKKA